MVILPVRSIQNGTGLRGTCSLPVIPPLIRTWDQISGTLEIGTACQGHVLEQRAEKVQSLGTEQPAQSQGAAWQG